MQAESAAVSPTARSGWPTKGPFALPLASNDRHVIVIGKSSQKSDMTRSEEACSRDDSIGLDPLEPGFGGFSSHGHTVGSKSPLSYAAAHRSSSASFSGSPVPMLVAGCCPLSQFGSGLGSIVIGFG